MSISQAVKNCISKIEENRRLNAVIEVNPDALTIAENLEKAPDKKGVLYGMPVLIKDNVNTGDKMRTAAGSLALAGNIAKEDAPAVKLLREAGAVILGKANMTEFANYMSDNKENRMPSGYSSRGGQTIHPIDPSVNPSGSSSGSAVAVAAGLCPMAVGSETYGSIISPAQRCGIVGLKPTDGLISKKGAIPISFTLDTLGPMARSVDEAGALLSGLTGRQYTVSGSITGLRLGLCRNFIEGEHPPWRTPDPEWLKASESLVNILKNLGAVCKPIENHNIDDSFVRPIMRHEFQYAMNTYLSTCQSPNVPKTLAEIIEYNEKHAATALKYDQNLLITASKISENWKTEPEYVQALSDRNNAIADLDKYFDDNEIDLLFMLSADYGLAAATGFPSITLPIGKTEKGVPIGCCFIGRRFGEESLLSVAKAVESALA